MSCPVSIAEIQHDLKASRAQAHWEALSKFDKIKREIENDKQWLIHNVWEHDYEDLCDLINKLITTGGSKEIQEELTRFVEAAAVRGLEK